MKYDYAVVFILVVVGANIRKLTWKHWYAIFLFIFAWMMFTWWRDK